ncbi:MAG: XRE family transcriptional regulator [Thermoprotei archaeon]|nr:MAG: XRE family transcriptional regulator [Thermoprotei archaeon]
MKIYLVMYTLIIGSNMSSLPTPEELRRMRIRAGLTQKEVAERAKVSQSLIARIESGSVDPRLSTLRKVMKVLEEALRGREEESVRVAMNTPVIMLSEEDDVRTAAKIMWEKGISQIPVVDSNGRVVGTVHENSLMKLLVFERGPRILGLKVSEVMEDPLPILDESASLTKAMRLLLEGFPAVLVKKGSKIVGIVTKSDIIALHILRRASKPSEVSS